MVSVAVVAGLVERALAVTDDTIPDSMTVLLMGLCIVAGLAMPALALFAIAWDGSSLSRENDSLAKQLQAGLGEDQQLRREAVTDGLECQQDELLLTTQVMPTIHRIATDGVDEMREVYAFLLMQLGVDADVDPHPAAHPEHGTDGLETGIPGTDIIWLEPFVRRGLRIQELRLRRIETIAKLEALPAHPWAGTRSQS